MTDQQIIVLINGAVKKLFNSDKWLLIHDLSEQSISHKLAEYLQPLFNGYNVDCEYNGNIEQSDGRKRIWLIKNELQKTGLLRAEEATDLEKEFTDRSVFPDIIIHRRGRNEDNLCIVEIKKDSSTVSADYDYLKLCSYTGDSYQNDLRYQMGVFIRFYTRDNLKYPQILLFKNGGQHLI